MVVIDILAKISVPILTLVTALLTYYIHRLSSENAKKENYLRYITDLYYRIEDNSKHYKGDEINRLTETARNQNTRELKVNCTLMIYYLQRYPGFYGNRTMFISLLKNIIDSPEDEKNFNFLSDAFRDFCLNTKKDSKNEPDHFYINGREVGFPEKE